MFIRFSHEDSHLATGIIIIIIVIVVVVVVILLYIIYNFSSTMKYFKKTYPNEPTLPYSEYPVNPSCLQATVASLDPNESSQTVCHTPFKKISRRPDD